MSWNELHLLIEEFPNFLFRFDAARNLYGYGEPDHFNRSRECLFPTVGNFPSGQMTAADEQVHVGVVRIRDAVRRMSRVGW